MARSESEFAALEGALFEAGRVLDFGSTPPLAAAVRARLLAASAGTAPRLPAPRPFWRPRLALSLAAALLLALALLLGFPQTRDAIAQFLGLRTVQIINVTPTPLATPAQTPRPAPPATVTPALPVTAAPELASATIPALTATATLTRAAGVQCCQVPLAEARSRATVPVLLPPDEQPSRVYFARYGPGEQVVLLFGDPAAPRYALYIATQLLYRKVVSGGTVIAESQVQGERALWFTGVPHLLLTFDARGREQIDSERTVGANTLAWETGDANYGTTFRLETSLPLADAVRFANSLR